MSKSNRRFELALVAGLAAALLAGCPDAEQRLQGKWGRTETSANVITILSFDFKDGQMIQTTDVNGGPRSRRTITHEQIVFDIARATRTLIELTQISAEYTSELSGSDVTDAMRQDNDAAAAGANTALQNLNGRQVTKAYMLSGSVLTLDGIALVKETSSTVNQQA